MPICKIDTQVMDGRRRDGHPEPERSREATRNANRMHEKVGVQLGGKALMRPMSRPGFQQAESLRCSGFKRTALGFGGQSDSED
jgi:hypothetical protein